MIKCSEGHISISNDTINSFETIFTKPYVLIYGFLQTFIFFIFFFFFAL